MQMSSFLIQNSSCLMQNSFILNAEFIIFDRFEFKNAAVSNFSFKMMDFALQMMDFH